MTKAAMMKSRTSRVMVNGPMVILLAWK